MKKTNGTIVSKASALLAGVAVAVAILVSLVTAPAEAQSDDRAFANPEEITTRPGEKRLRAIMELIDGDYRIPNVGTAHLRQYRGWDAAKPEPTPLPPGAPIPPAHPGPTLRVRLGDQVQIAFLNKVNDKKNFSYSFVTNSPPGRSSFGCDEVYDSAINKFIYPGKDLFPNCFHGSSTANIHFHGTHTSPDGLGDNVLVQVLPKVDQPDFTASFDRIFNSRKVPQKWADMPLAYRRAQMRLVREHDIEAAADARKNKLPPPEPLAMKNEERIAAGLWPQYFIGAFPNFFDIPDYDSGKFKAGQAPGTHWYHAHKHGSTSLHIRNGLAGALIIESSQEGGYDHYIRKFYGWDKYEGHEKIFVFQQYDPTQNLERPGTRGVGSRQTLVNGKFKPVLTMRPGEVQLWRFINATEGNLRGGVIDGGTATDGLFKVPPDGFVFKQIAQDGVQFSSVNYNNQPFLSGMVPDGFKLAAGNRADLLVQAPTTPGVVEFKIPNGGENVTIFSVNVTGTPEIREKPFPTVRGWMALPSFLRDLPTATPFCNVNTVRFQWEPGREQPAPVDGGDPPHYMINDKQFEEKGEVVDQCMPLDGIQDWTLENWTTRVAHPFHIHINPFQVIKIEKPKNDGTFDTYEPKDNYVWQDVIAIPPAIIKDGKTTPGRVTIRHTFLDFHGTFVLHCHILAHEDRGMMQLVRIVPANEYPKGCQDHIPAHH